MRKTYRGKKLTKSKLLSRFLANGAVRNSMLEEYHAQGKLSDKELRALMIEVETSLTSMIAWLQNRKVISYGKGETAKEIYEQIADSFFSSNGVSYDDPKLDKKEAPYVAFGNDELTDKEDIKDFTICPKCKKSHKVKYGERVLSDGKREPSKMLGFVKCQDESVYLVAINGKKVS